MFSTIRKIPSPSGLKHEALAITLNSAPGACGPGCECGRACACGCGAGESGAERSESVGVDCRGRTYLVT